MLEISILDVWCLTHHQASNSSKTSPKKIPPSYAARHVEARISGILRINAMVGITVKDHATTSLFNPSGGLISVMLLWIVRYVHWGQRFINVDLEVFLFLLFQRGWFLFFKCWASLHQHKKKTRLYPIATRHRHHPSTPTPINHQIRGALLLVPQIGLVVTCQSDTFPCAPVLRAQHRRAVLGENSGAGSLCLPKKKTERSSKPTMFRLLEKRNGWWKSWMYGILSNTQGNLWICMLLHPVCFEIVFANHKPFLPFTKLRLVVSMEKKHTSSWFGTPIAHDSAQLGRVLLKMFLISTSFHLIFLQPNKFTWKTS